MKKTKKIAGIVGVIVAVVIMDLMVFGCGTFGNGQIDVPVDISVEWHDAMGNGFVLIDGQLESATYKSVKTGIIYEYAKDEGVGSFAITEPHTGATVKIRQRVKQPKK